MSALSDVFRTYCQSGHKDLDCRGFIKLSRECGLQDDVFADSDAESVFMRVMPARRRLDFPRFEDALRLVGASKGVEEAVVHQVLLDSFSAIARRSESVPVPGSKHKHRHFSGHRQSSSSSAGRTKRGKHHAKESHEAEQITNTLEEPHAAPHGTGFHLPSSCPAHSKHRPFLRSNAQQFDSAPTSPLMEDPSSHADDIEGSASPEKPQTLRSTFQLASSCAENSMISPILYSDPEQHPSLRPQAGHQGVARLVSHCGNDSSEVDEARSLAKDAVFKLLSHCPAVLSPSEPLCPVGPLPAFTTSWQCQTGLGDHDIRGKEIPVEVHAPSGRRSMLSASACPTSSMPFLPTPQESLSQPSPTKDSARTPSVGSHRELWLDGAWPKNVEGEEVAIQQKRPRSPAGALLLSRRMSSPALGEATHDGIKNQKAPGRSSDDSTLHTMRPQRSQSPSGHGDQLPRGRLHPKDMGRNAQITDRFEQTFLLFCGDNAGLDSKGFSKLCKKCCLLDSKFKSHDARLVFASSLPISQQLMDLQTFRNALTCLAVQKDLDKGLVRRMVAWYEEPTLGATEDTSEKHPHTWSEGFNPEPVPTPATPHLPDDAAGPRVSRCLSKSRVLKILRRSESVPCLGLPEPKNTEYSSSRPAASLRPDGRIAGSDAQGQDSPSRPCTPTRHRSHSKSSISVSQALRLPVDISVSNPQPASTFWPSMPMHVLPGHVSPIMPLISAC